MFQKIGDAIRRFMYGRNGVDTLAWISLVVGIVINLIGSRTGQSFFICLAYVPLFYALFRMFSKNVEKRQEENEKLTQFIARIKGRRYYRYFKCPGCRTRVRVPKGKGTIRITCPSCREKFTKKT